ncbi:hypothetical protein G9A89_022166 [Geosiphon pyriformis]|nr:hypothetical protein G9A89_022166 [Geosiphon pyriformis]
MVGPSIAVIKKIVKNSGFGGGFKPVLLRKKRKDGALEENIRDKKSSVKELSELDIKTKKALDKPLERIDFANHSDMNNVLSDGPLELPPSLKNLVNISVWKSFALDIGFDKVAGKFFQEKLNFVRKTFSDVNGFEGVFTLSKFGRIIHATLTSEAAMMAVTRLANDCGIMVNTNLKRPGSNCMNQAIVLKEILVKTSVEAVHMAVSKFGLVLVNTMTVTPVIKSVGLHWSHFSQALCVVCKGFGYISLSGWSVKDAVVLGGRKTPFLAQNQFRLARIYVKKSAPISCSLAFDGKTWTSVVGALSVHTSYGAGMSLGSNKIGKPFSPVVDNLELHLIRIESSLVSLVRQISELAKRLKSLVPAVSQSSLRCQLPVAPPLQNQGENIVMRMSLGKVISDKIDPIVNSAASPYIVKLENMLEGLSKSVLILSAHFDSLALASGITSLISSQ